MQPSRAGGGTARGDPEAVAAVREFNRFWTRQIGVLQAGLLDTEYSLTEARVLFEIAQRDATDASELREVLDLDAGYLSRVLRGLKDRRLVDARPSEEDARRQLLRLTETGTKEFRELDRRSAREVEVLLEPLADRERRRLTGCMTAIHDLIVGRPTSPSFVMRPPLPGDLGWVIHRHGALYAEEFGWDETFEALVARIVAGFADDHDPRREAVWIAERDGQQVGSVFCCRKDDETAQLRLLLVEPRERGLGIGSRLTEECIRFARRAGYRRMVLWTNDVLVSARRIYEAAGFVLTAEEAHHSFGHDLVGQDWELDLAST